MFQPRLFYLLVLVFCAGLLGFGFYLQYVRELEPCPLCMIQRLFYASIGLVSLAAVLHNPGRTGIKIYAGLSTLLATAGALIAARQVWLQHLPADKVPDCGPDLAYMLEAYPFMQTLKTILTGTGECAEVVWTFLGFSIPEWSLLMFILIALGSLYQIRTASAR